MQGWSVGVVIVGTSQWKLASEGWLVGGGQ